MLDSLESVVRAEIESELIFTAHTNVVLINQILRQAETQRVSIGVDVFKLEDRCVDGRAGSIHGLVLLGPLWFLCRN